MLLLRQQGVRAIEASLIALGIQEGSVVYTQTLTAPPTVLVH